MTEWTQTPELKPRINDQEMISKGWFSSYPLHNLIQATLLVL